MIFSNFRIFFKSLLKTKSQKGRMAYLDREVGRQIDSKNQKTPNWNTKSLSNSKMPNEKQAVASLVAQQVKNLLQCKKPRFDPWAQKILWRREWLPTPVFLPGKFNVHPENKDHGIWSHHFMANRWGNNGNSDRLYFGGLQKSLQMVTAARN